MRPATVHVTGALAVFLLLSAGPSGAEAARNPEIGPLVIEPHGVAGARAWQTIEGVLHELDPFSRCSPDGVICVYVVLEVSWECFESWPCNWQVFRGAAWSIATEPSAGVWQFKLPATWQSLGGLSGTCVWTGQCQTVGANACVTLDVTVCPIGAYTNVTPTCQDSFVGAQATSWLGSAAHLEVIRLCPP